MSINVWNASSNSLDNVGGLGGDMRKTVYDTNKNGIVDDSERLGGKLPSEYALKDSAAAMMDYSDSILTLKNTEGDVLSSVIINSSGSGSETVLQGTLNRGVKTLIFTNSKITTSSAIDVYSDIYGYGPDDIQVETGKLTMEFESGFDEVVNFKVVIKNI